MKHKHFFIAVFFLVISILFVQNTWAQVPQTMSYQGVLMKAKGTLVQNGQYTLTFKLYDAAEGGKVLWSETQTVPVEDGLFNAALGSLNSLDIPFDQPYWLAVTIGDGEEVSRRMQLTSSAYSLQAQTVADKAITSKKIADGHVVRSINSVTDNVKLTAGENVTITQKGDELVISANSRKGDELVTLAKARTKDPDQGAPERVVESLLVNGVFGVKDPTSGNFTLAVLNDQVGIGTTTPGRRLHVVSENSNAQIILGDPDAGLDLKNWFLQSRLGDFRIGRFDDAVSPGGILNAVTVSSTGNVGIGTTGPTAQLHTTGSVRFAGFGAGTLQTDANGNVSVSSDVRLKKIKGNFDRGLSAILQIDPINYTWKQESGLDTENTYTGFSAQNVQDVIPEAVKKDKKGHLTLSDRPIIATLVNAVKELKAENEAIKIDNSELKAELETLKSSLTQLEETLQKFAAAKPAGKEETHSSAVDVSEPR